MSAWYLPDCKCRLDDREAFKQQVDLDQYRFHRPHTYVWPVQYAMEANRGQCVATHPVFETEEEAREAASYIDKKRPDLPPVRILRREIGPWKPVETAETDETEGLW